MKLAAQSKSWFDERDQLSVLDLPRGIPQFGKSLRNLTRPRRSDHSAGRDAVAQRHSACKGEDCCGECGEASVPNKRGKHRDFIHTLFAWEQPTTTTTGTTPLEEVDIPLYRPSCCCVVDFEVSLGLPENPPQERINRMNTIGLGERNHAWINWKVKTIPLEEPGDPCTFEYWEKGDTKGLRAHGSPGWSDTDWNPSHRNNSRGQTMSGDFSRSQSGGGGVWEDHDNPGSPTDMDFLLLLIIRSGCPGCMDCCAMFHVTGSNPPSVKATPARCGGSCEKPGGWEGAGPLAFPYVSSITGATGYFGVPPHVRSNAELFAAFDAQARAEARRDAEAIRRFLQGR